MVFASKEAAQKYAQNVNGEVKPYRVMFHSEEVIIYKVERKEK